MFPIYTQILEQHHIIESVFHTIMHNRENDVCGMIQSTWKTPPPFLKTIVLE